MRPSSHIPFITGADGRKYQTYELTGAGVTAEGESGRPWRGYDPTEMGRHWGNSHRKMDEWDDRARAHPLAQENRGPRRLPAPASRRAVRAGGAPSDHRRRVDRRLSPVTQIIPSRGH